MRIKEKLPLINNSIKSIRIAGYVLYPGVILVVLGAILLSTPPALAEDKIAMTKSLYTQIPDGKEYDFTAYIPLGWSKNQINQADVWSKKAFGPQPQGEELWHGAYVSNAFYLYPDPQIDPAIDRGVIEIGAFAIPANLKGKDHRSIVEDLIAYLTNKENLNLNESGEISNGEFDGKPALIFQTRVPASKVRAYLFPPDDNDVLLLVGATAMPTKANPDENAWDLLDKMTVRNAWDLLDKSRQELANERHKDLSPAGSKPETQTVSSVSTHSATTEPTKTAYTRDGQTFVSRERMEENVLVGVAERGDYKEVQVPLDTPIAGTMA
jgi:hypothetical protein